jgi:hypothetical protein
VGVENSSFVTADEYDISHTLASQVSLMRDFRDKEFALNISVKRAIREHGVIAEGAIRAELSQMVDKKVWTLVKLDQIPPQRRSKIIRSKMFCKAKFHADGSFDKFKARLVAGGDMQIKTDYDDLSAPTVATSSVFATAAIAAAEGRHVMAIDIGCAYLNAPMATGVQVHMRLNADMTTILQSISSDYNEYVDHKGCVVVVLDKALYGCIESASLWYHHLARTLTSAGYVPNPYDRCVFNKTNSKGIQCTLALHVDDLFVSSVDPTMLDDLTDLIRVTYKECKRQDGPYLGYLGMNFDFSILGVASVTMKGYIHDLLLSCGVEGGAKTPASDTLFHIRESGVPDNPIATTVQAKDFHRQVARVLYLAKRVMPECLTAVSFLSTRVTRCDSDDLKKLVRLLRYIRSNAHRGIRFSPGTAGFQVRCWIDAAYGIHSDGKSHTGSVVTVGNSGPVHAKSSKQTNVTKSSTEAELVGLSDSANQGFFIRNFILAQGHKIGPLIIYQDNLSCMALVERGRSAAERTRHIAIRYFWISERVSVGECTVEHKPSLELYANLLTKPLQGPQFLLERTGLSNW